MCERDSLGREPDAHPVGAADWLARLAAGAPIEAPAAAVAAHPDDETLGLGLRLASFRALTLIHVTDGAPDAPEHAQRAGFADRETYAAARGEELTAALEALGASPHCVALGFHDQASVFHLPELVDALAERLAGAAVVATHAYEGGHPDHDAAAMAVQLACGRLRGAGRRAPVRLEFAGYHQGPEGLRTGAFWPDPGGHGVSPDPDPVRLAAKRAALERHRSQAEVIAWFDPAQEAYRAAPDYDFTAPPPPGAALYDSFDWPVTSELWRKQARAMLARERGTAA